VVLLAVIPLLVSAEHLWWSRWKLAAVVLGVLAVAALLVQAFIASREEKDTRELMAGIAAKLGLVPSQASASLSPSVESAIISSDPRIYPEIEDKTTAAGGFFFLETPFMLRNDGGDVAHDVAIEPLHLYMGRVTFETVDTIHNGHSSQVFPNVENAGIFRHRNIKTALIKEWNAAGELTSELSKAMRTTYNDYTRKRKFETSFDLVYHPILDIGRQGRRNEALDKANPVLRIRNVRIRLIS